MIARRIVLFVAVDVDERLARVPLAVVVRVQVRLARFFGFVDDAVE